METLVTSEEIVETIMDMTEEARLCFDDSVNKCIGVVACVNGIIDKAPKATHPFTMMMTAILMGISIGRVLERKRLEVGFLDKLVRD